jgi:hypothetical protein
VVTGGMRNRMRAQGIEAPRGAYDGRKQRLEVGCSRLDGARKAPPPGCFAKRVRKLLKPKDRSVEKSAKRGQRGGKLLRTWDLPQIHGDTELKIEGAHPTPQGNSDRYQKKGVAGKAIRKSMKTKDRQNWRIGNTRPVAGKGGTKRRHCQQPWVIDYRMRYYLSSEKLKAVD